MIWSFPNHFLRHWGKHFISYIINKEFYVSPFHADL
uniref:Uncharacterized protein n=1 Tax=Anguilla anguilla TaxID=7936 RepID=A0A0E9T4H2_ANGAN